MPLLDNLGHIGHGGGADTGGALRATYPMRTLIHGDPALAPAATAAQSSAELSAVQRRTQTGDSPTKPFLTVHPTVASAAQRKSRLAPAGAPQGRAVWDAGSPDRAAAGRVMGANSEAFQGNLRPQDKEGRGGWEGAVLN